MRCVRSSFQKRTIHRSEKRDKLTSGNARVAGSRTRAAEIEASTRITLADVDFAERHRIRFWPLPLRLSDCWTRVVLVPVPDVVVLGFFLAGEPANVVDESSVSNHSRLVSAA